MGCEHEQRKTRQAPALNPRHGCCYFTLLFGGWGHVGLCLSIKENPILALPPARLNPSPRQESPQ